MSSAEWCDRHKLAFGSESGCPGCRDERSQPRDTSRLPPDDPADRRRWAEERREAYEDRRRYETYDD